MYQVLRYEASHVDVGAQLRRGTFLFFPFQGAVDFKNGDRFEGEFHHNEIHGPNGELRCVSGLMYRGEWRHSKVITQRRL